MTNIIIKQNLQLPKLEFENLNEFLEAIQFNKINIEKNSFIEYIESGRYEKDKKIGPFNSMTELVNNLKKI